MECKIIVFGYWLKSMWMIVLLLMMVVLWWLHVDLLLLLLSLLLIRVVSLSNWRYTSRCNTDTTIDTCWTKTMRIHHPRPARSMSACTCSSSSSRLRCMRQRICDRRHLRRCW